MEHFETLPSGVRRVRFAPPAMADGDTPHANREQPSGSLNMETLAYALPAGLAKLAYKNWQYAKFLKYIEDDYLKILDGQSVKRMYSAPPRSGKTNFVSRILPAHFLGRRPDERVLLITYNQEFSRTQSRFARNVIKAYGKKVFGIEVAEDSATANHWQISGHEGGMEAVGAGGSITGKGCNLLIVDDLIKGYEQATNVKLLEEMWVWFRTDVYSRLEPDASVIVIATRWSLYDVIGMIKNLASASYEEGELNPYADWQSVNFPALATADDVLGRKPGEALFPERFNEKRLREIQAVQDPYWFSALYMGDPVAMSGEIINPEWFRNRYNDPLPRENYEMVLVSADTAIKDTEIADYSVFQIWGVKDGQYHLIDNMREKIQYPALLELARGLASSWRPEFFLIEDKGSGSSLIQELRLSDVNVWPMDPGKESKVLRMQGETPALREGRIWLPRAASWLDEFLLECRAFPRGKRDQCDALSQFLKFMRVHGESRIEMF